MNQGECSRSLPELCLNQIFLTRPSVAFSIALLCLAMTACEIYPVRAAEDAPQTQASASGQQNGPVIENDSDLPDTYPGARYELVFHAHGGVPVLHWRLEKGTLPPGTKLEDSGLLHGSPERSGEFQFTVSVTDSGKPQQSVQKQFFLRIRSAMTLVWKTPAHVSSNRIDGSVEVANTTPDDIDLTFVCLAVAANGRATAIGYQHFVLARGVTKELPFGETLPNGGYVIHADAVGEVEARNLIYRERLQTPGPLQVVVGP
jgi:hypothetical protein